MWAAQGSKGKKSNYELWATFELGKGQNCISMKICEHSGGRSKKTGKNGTLFMDGPFWGISKIILDCYYLDNERIFVFHNLMQLMLWLQNVYLMIGVLVI